MNRIALVTGSNKGIGFEVVKQLCQKNPFWTVYLTARDIDRGQTAFGELKALGLSNVRFNQLDLDSADSIRSCAEYIKKEHGGLDVLVNNAALTFPKGSTATFGEKANVCIRTNYYGTLNVCDAFFPLLRDNATVVTVSSRAGHVVLSKLSSDLQNAFKKCTSIEDVNKLVDSFVELAQQDGHVAAGWADSAYGTSKLAVTVATYIQHAMLQQGNVNVVINACCPGYVKTNLTGYSGEKTPEEGADTPVYLAMLPTNCQEPRGRFVNEQIINDLF